MGIAHSHVPWSNDRFLYFGLTGMVIHLAESMLDTMSMIPVKGTMTQSARQTELSPHVIEVKVSKGQI